MSTLENPFHPPLKGSGETDTEKDVKLVQKLLGDEDAALLASVRGKQEQRTETMPTDIMTDEEREMLAKAEKRESEQMWDREKYMEWAKSIGMNDTWVDNNFEFNEDGSIETKGDLDLGYFKSLSSFPSNLTTVHGGLSLYRLTTADNFILPQTVRGHLSLDDLTTADNLVLPQTVGGSLNLSGLTSADNLTLPQTVGGSLSLDNLTSAERTVWPKRIGLNLYIPRVFSAQAEQLKASGVLKGDIEYTY